MTGIGEQLGHALVRGPLAIRRLRARGWAWVGVYLALASIISYVAARQLIVHRPDLERLLIEYILPDGWTFAGELLIERFFRAQRHAVLINAAIGGSLLLVQLLLFPVKEQVSATFEREASLVAELPNEHPLWFQAWEEVKLFLAFLAAQGSIFWLGYSRDPGRQTLALVLSYGFLFASFGIDFLAPVLQRHRQRYSTMLKTLLLHPVLLLAFGALFTLPAVLVGKWIEAHPAMPFGRAVTMLFAANVVCVAWAAVAGTFCGAHLLADARATRRPAAATRVLAWAFLLGLLAWNGYRLGAVGLALHHKSQILKCEYSLDWTSVGIDRPGPIDLIGGLRRDAVEVGVHFDVTIKNPTRFDVEIEENRLEVVHAGQRVATARLTPVRVPAHGQVEQRMALPLRLTPSQLARGTELLRAEGWAITLYLEVASGFELPIYLLDPGKP